MSNDLMFDAISGVQAEWRDRMLNVPLRYSDSRSFAATFRTPVEFVEGLLPEPVHPLRWGRQEAVTAIAFNDFGESDIGPYREIVVGFPVSVGEKTLPYVGLRSYAKRGGALLMHYMVLDDQVAIDLGVEIAGYPKHMGEVGIEFDDATMRCTWSEDGDFVLQLTAPRPTPTPVDLRDRTDVITTRHGSVLRSELVGYVGRAGRVDGSAIRLEFGAHPRAEMMRNLTLGKCMGGRLLLDRQLALSPPLEAW